jgi:Sec-independent protein secretion pathway component TatC
MDEKKAPLATYLQEIRRRLILSFIGVGVGFVICYGFSDSIFDVLAAPLIKMMPAENTLIFRTVAEAFFTYMKVGFVAGLMLASPGMGATTTCIIWRRIKTRGEYGYERTLHESFHLIQQRKPDMG